MSKYQKICENIAQLSPDIKVTEERGCIVLRGEVDDWTTVVKAGQLAVDKKRYLGVINDIKLKGFVPKPHLTSVQDKSLDGVRPDVLIVGGGITGCAIARELSKWNLNTVLVEKGPDVAVGASRANGGVVHVGINFPRKSQKHYYNIRGNQMYAELSRQMDVPFEQKGQVMLCCKKWEKIPVRLLQLNAKAMGIPGVRYLKREDLKEHEPCLPDFAIGGMYMPIGGITNPYEMTVALAENAVKNGSNICLNTTVLGMCVKAGHIVSVDTNRGKLYPKLVINASGVYADVIAEMADDRTFTIHPRRGTDIITDKKAGYMVKTSMAKSPFSILPYQNAQMPKGPIARVKFFIDALKGSSHTKGVGLIHSVHGNMLIGPNAVETPDREDVATQREEVEGILKMQQHIAQDLKFSDVIAYFTGVRAPTYEEDFVVRKGVFTDNILEAAGIQSPGVTAAPAIAVDISKWTVEYLAKEMPVKKVSSFDPVRHAPPHLAEMCDEERDALIHKNSDYGVIVCRCEEVSKGEIIDALNSPICVPTLDGIKRRLRPGMGRCQGGFCSPLVMQIIAEHQGVPISAVKKSSEESVVTYGETKGTAE
jgi:glycerol-3-phosphate dehydrogenase